MRGNRTTSPTGPHLTGQVGVRRALAGGASDGMSPPLRCLLHCPLHLLAHSWNAGRQTRGCALCSVERRLPVSAFWQARTSCCLRGAATVCRDVRRKQSRRAALSGLAGRSHRIHGPQIGWGMSRRAPSALEETLACVYNRGHTSLGTPLSAMAFLCRRSTCSATPSCPSPFQGGKWIDSSPTVGEVGWGCAVTMKRTCSATPPCPSPFQFQGGKWNDSSPTVGEVGWGCAVTRRNSRCARRFC